MLKIVPFILIIKFLNHSFNQSDDDDIAIKDSNSGVKLLPFLTTCVCLFLHFTGHVQVVTCSEISSTDHQSSGAIKCHTTVAASRAKSYYRNLVDMRSAITDLGGDTTVAELRYMCECITGSRRIGLTVDYPSNIACNVLDIEIVCPPRLTIVGDWVAVYEGDPEVVPTKIPPRDGIEDILEREMGCPYEPLWCDQMRNYWAEADDKE